MSDMHPLSGAYAVNALDDLERVRFERHLEECGDCAAEVRSLQEAAGVLSLAVDPAPSAELRSRVLAEIHTVRPLPPMVRQREVVRRTTRRFPRLVAAAVAGVLLIGGGVVAAQQLGGDQQQQVAPVALPERVIDAPDARTQAIAFDDGSKATLYHSKSVGRAVLKTQSMADAPDGKVYELWFQKDDGAFVPAGLMPSGGTQTVLLHGKVAGAQGVGITVEPASGSVHPTSAPVAMFKLSKSV